MAWIVAPNLARLRANIRSVPAYADMVIGSIGDDAHKLRTSSHNPDDTPGSRAEYSDPDNVAEVRALDLMVGQIPLPHMEALRRALTDDLRSRPRLAYVIFRGRIWRRSTGFRMETFDGDFHGDHIHLSGYAPDDENGSDWPAVLALGAGEDDDMFCKFGDPISDKVRYLQHRLASAGYDPGEADGDYRDKTAAAVKAVDASFGATNDGRVYGPEQAKRLDWRYEMRAQADLRSGVAAAQATANAAKAAVAAHTANHPAGIAPGARLTLTATVTGVG